jgi:hypothetical protein
VFLGRAPGVVNGDILKLTVIADNGGNDIINQTWLNDVIFTAYANVGSSDAVLDYPGPDATKFTTNSLGQLTFTGFIDSPGSDNTDSIGTGSQRAYLNIHDHYIDSLNKNQGDNYGKYIDI